MKLETLKIRNSVSEAIDIFYKTNGFYEVAPPILTSFSCEVACIGGSDLISVNYYGKKMFLSQSSQLYLEALALQLGRAYCVNPAFRAESTLLATHLSEFWMCEAEMLNINFPQLVQNINDLLTAIIAFILEKNHVELESLGVNTVPLEKVKKNSIPQITYSEAISILKKEHVSIEWGEDIQDSHNRILSQYFDNLPIMITMYPKKLSSFYKQACPDNPDITFSFDLIAPDGYRELASGSMRETDITRLRESLHSAGVTSTPYEWYFDMISSNPETHGGYGLGIERLVSWLCNLPTIQDSIPFPRTEEILWP